ncbi:MAG: 4Fe-4S binding protein [Elusimicrobia bacterium]|nr:4Fe-4S binding protein [Elusimicrobiota bacterium]
MKKILIDLEKYYKIKSFGGGVIAECSYYYHQLTGMDAPKNNGVEKLLAKAAQYVICRQCKSADCILACPNEALEKNDKGILQRYSMRCTSCKSCSVACPFGTIYTDILSYKTSQCDYCIGRCKDKPPLCVETCRDNILQWVDMKEDESKNIYKISDKLLVYSLKWKK